MSGGRLPTSLTVINNKIVNVRFTSFFGDLNIGIAIVRVVSRVLKNVSGRLSTLLHTSCTGQNVRFLLDAGIISLTRARRNTIISCRGTRKTKDIVTRGLLVDIKHHPIAGNFKLRGLGLRQARHKDVMIGKRVRDSLPKICIYNSLAKFSLLTRATIHRTRMTMRTVLKGRSEVDCTTVPKMICAGPRVTNIKRARRSLAMGNVTCHTMGLPVTCSKHFITRGRKIGKMYGILLNRSSAVLKTRILNGPTSRVVALTKVTMRVGLGTTR